MRRLEIVCVALIAGLAAVLLFWNLDDKYLWQDEAATAVLGSRMLQFGKPLAYDGVNLITNDNFPSEDMTSIDQRTRDPRVAVDYYINRGDIKADTAWKYQPWGQFVVAAASLKLFGHTTFAARLPFSIAGLATVLLLYWFVRRYFQSIWIAFFAALLLVLNGYWILHSRQCRYYSLSGLFLMLTLVAYARWQWKGARWGAALFAATAWCWFQVDYGTVWPVLGILFVDALIAGVMTHQMKRVWEVLLAGIMLAAAIAPFAYYYELWRRISVPSRSWPGRLQLNLFNLNEYVVPVILLGAAAALLRVRWRQFAVSERRLIAIGCVLLFILTFWISSVAPEALLRYLVPAMPVGALLSAWVVVRSFETWRVKGFAGAAIAVLAITPLFCLPLNAFIPRPAWIPADRGVRGELKIVMSQIFGHSPDPNRIVVEWLKRNASPTDEILINYEDIPLMFYLPNPIRGGIPAFRAEDDAKMPARFIILRHVAFTHWPVYQRVVERYHWTQIPTKAPDIAWGNNPDPTGQAQNPAAAQPLVMARREDR